MSDVQSGISFQAYPSEKTSKRLCWLVGWLHADCNLGERDQPVEETSTTG